MEALTTKTFKTSKISAVEVSERQLKDFKYKSIKFAYDGEEAPPPRVDGNFIVFKFENKNGSTYSLVINCTGDNESFFRKLNSALDTQRSCKILKDHTVIPENFELVKENKYGCSVFAKIYLKKSGKAKCRVSKGSYKNLIEIDELVDENFSGRCILKVYQPYIGLSKSISLSVEEIPAKGLIVKNPTLLTRAIKAMRVMMMITSEYNHWLHFPTRDKKMRILVEDNQFWGTFLARVAFYARLGSPKITISLMII